MPPATRGHASSAAPGNHHLIGIQCRGCFELPVEGGGGAVKFEHDSVIAAYVKGWIAVLALARWTQAGDASALLRLNRYLKSMRYWSEHCPDCIARFGRNRDYQRKYTENETQDNGTEVRFKEEKDGLVPVVYDLCGDSDPACVKWVSRDRAVSNFGEFSDVCKNHRHDRDFQRERLAERAAAQNGDGQKDKGAVKYGRGRKTGDVLLPRDRVRDDFIEIVQYLHDVKKVKANKIKRAAILAEYNIRGERIKGREHGYAPGPSRLRRGR